MTFDPYRALAAVAVGTAMAFPAAAQDEAAVAPETPAFEIPTYTPEWSTPELEAIAGMISGSWAAGDTSDVVMNVAPAPVEGMADTLYVELARAGELQEPFRHAVFQLFSYKDGVRLRTYEMALPAAQKEVFTAMWAAPGYFPKLSADDLIATMDVDLAPSGGGYSGGSPYAYPTGTGGAVEMTNGIELTQDSLTTHDQGIGADGEVAWEATYAFERSEPALGADIRDDGMVVIEYSNPGEVMVADGDRLHIHYSGWLSDSTLFDASRPRGRPFIFSFPPGNQAIVGWGLGMEGISIGTRRKLVIPGYLGYGPAGNPRAGIPGDSTLIFDVECMHIDKPEPDPVQTPDVLEDPAAADQQPGEAGGGG